MTTTVSIIHYVNMPLYIIVNALVSQWHNLGLKPRETIGLDTQSQSHIDIRDKPTYIAKNIGVHFALARMVNCKKCNKLQILEVRTIEGQLSNTNAATPERCPTAIPHKHILWTMWLWLGRII
jgi:hypothetical protein